VGLARHSETLEEMVIYETRYENARGKVWVRPKEMFFESVDVDGKSVPRFRPIPLQITEKTKLEEGDIKVIVALLEKAFGEFYAKTFYSTLNEQQKFHLALATVEDQPVGFKLGYQLDSVKFYSWLGGVLPEYRGLGIAADLMRFQHDWCKKAGYEKIQTKTQNRFRDMFILNLRHGFEVVDSYESKEGWYKIVLEKKLTN
jgi:GNAT superfamily N-acetyltransferase